MTVGESTNLFNAKARYFGDVDLGARVISIYSGVKSRQLKQRLGEAPHLLRGVQTGFDGVAIFMRRALPGKSGLRLGDDDCKRRAQLVRGIRRKLTLPREG